MSITRVDSHLPIPRLATPLSIQYGEKSGDYSFFPYRRHIFTEQGIKRSITPRLTTTPNVGTGFAAINLGSAPASHEGIEIPVNRAVLVAHHFESVAARVRIEEPGVYFVAARFVAAAPFEGAYAVDACVNGMRLWQSDIVDANSECSFSAFVDIATTSFVDLATNANKDGQTVPCRTFIEYAIVRCDERTGAPLLRCDDGISGIDAGEVLRLHGQTPFSPVKIAAPVLDSKARAALFEQEWTIDQEYIESQYQRSPHDLVKLLLKHKSEASLKYCVFMIPRSGSTLLAELLARTHRLGFPGESFVPDIVRTFSLAFADTFDSYEDFLVRQLRTENGVFGIEVEPERFREESRFFADVKDWRHIYIWREDILAQAISLQISNDTGVWHSFSPGSQEAQFHYILRSAIIWQINYLLSNEKYFRDYFAQNGLSPYRISYEALIADPVGEAQRIAQHIGVACSAADFAGSGKTVLHPTAKSRNAYYKLLAIAGGGDMWGYDIVKTDTGFMAVLHGVDTSLLDTSVERSPVLFLADSEQSIREKVNLHVMRQVAAMPRMDDGSDADDTQPASPQDDPHAPRGLIHRITTSLRNRDR